MRIGMKRARKHSRLAAVSLAAAVLCLCAIHYGRARAVAGGETGTGVATVALAPPAAAVARPAIPAPLPLQPQDDVIDGSQTPERIPDHAAFSVVFRLIADRKTDAEKRSIRAYINQLGLGEQKCDAAGADAKAAAKDRGQTGDESEIDAMIAVAEQYRQQVSVLDRQAKAIKDSTRGVPTAASLAKLTELKRQKEALVLSTVEGLERRLGPDATARLRRYINGRVKRHIKFKDKGKDKDEAQVASAR